MLQQLASTPEFGPRRYAAAMLLALEVAAARSAGALSRLAGRGGGTTLPGKLLSTVDPGAVDRLAARLPSRARCSSRRRTARRRRRRWSPRSSAARLAYNRSGANLLSGVASTLLDSPRRRARAVRGRRGGAARGRPPPAAARDRARQPLPRPARPLRRARARRRALARGARRRCPTATLVVNADDPLLGELARGRARTRSRLRPRRPRPRRAALQHAADSKYCRTCGTPYVYAAAYVGHLGDYRCPNGHAARGRRSRSPPAQIELHGLDGSAFTLGDAGRLRARRARRCRASTTSTTRPRPAAVAHALGALARARSPPGSSGSSPPSAASSGSRSATGGSLMLLIKNPAGANEAVRTLLDGAPPRLAVVALNDEIADGRDVSWIWDVDFEPLLAGLEQRRRLGRPRRRAGAALRLRRRSTGDRIEVVPDLEAGARPRPRADAGRRASSSSSRPTRRCWRCARSSRGRGLVPDFWEQPA